MSVGPPLLRKNCPVFEITTAPGEVNAWSENRLPFQPKGEMLEFRQRLAAAITALPPTPGAHLVATYTAAEANALIDTENVLFYNVGLGCFSAHWIAPVILEALIPGRMQSHASTAEVPRGVA